MARPFVLVALLSLTACMSRVSYEPMADREGIHAVVHRHWDEVEACYLKAIDERPGADGKVVMNWDVGPSGRAANVVVQEAGEKIKGAGTCLAERIREWEFPKTTRDEPEVNVTYPFYFSENGRFSR